LLSYAVLFAITVFFNHYEKGRLMGILHSYRQYAGDTCYAEKPKAISGEITSLLMNAASAFGEKRHQREERGAKLGWQRMQARLDEKFAPKPEPKQPQRVAPRSAAIHGLQLD
jgi:hypothetical protein